MDFEHIEFEGKKYYRTGCRKCQKADNWDIYFDGEVYVFKCGCGHIIKANPKEVQREPDKKAIPLHLIL